MTLKECYEALGGNYEEVISRLRSERLVQKFTLKFLDDKSLELLKESLQSENYEEAFRAAHTIKGICQNLSFDRLLASDNALTEALRNGKSPEADSLAKQVFADYEQTVSAIREFQASIG
ncbi:MAG: Hpt domain-containing protein [Lachnospiraceae bacterium]|jgi:HPt (histidine-containing phosphotransfer) domain-containing protein|nr:Hpt domain-containing protein [Lachnospiraceae bacterium]